MQFSFKYKTHLFHRCRQRHCSNAKYQVPVWPTCCKSRHQPLSSLVSPFLSHVRLDKILTVPFKRDFVSNRTFATLNTIQCLVACLCCSLNPWFTEKVISHMGQKKPLVAKQSERMVWKLKNWRCCMKQSQYCYLIVRSDRQLQRDSCGWALWAVILTW